MKIELNQEDLKKYLHFAFLGNYVINGCREPSKVIQEYEVLEKKLYALYYKVCCFGFESAMENTLADIRDRVYDELAEYIDQFENEIWLEKTAEIVAEREFETEKDEEMRMRKTFVAEILIQKRLRSDGGRIVHIDFPDLKFQTTKQIAHENNRWIWCANAQRLPCKPPRVCVLSAFVSVHPEQTEVGHKLRSVVSHEILRVSERVGAVQPRNAAHHQQMESVVRVHEKGQNGIHRRYVRLNGRFQSPVGRIKCPKIFLSAGADIDGVLPFGRAVRDREAVSVGVFRGIRHGNFRIVEDLLRFARGECVNIRVPEPAAPAAVYAEEDVLRSVARKIGKQNGGQISRVFLRRNFCDGFARFRLRHDDADLPRKQSLVVEGRIQGDILLAFARDAPARAGDQRGLRFPRGGCLRRRSRRHCSDQGSCT